MTHTQPTTPARAPRIAIVLLALAFLMCMSGAALAQTLSDLRAPPPADPPAAAEMEDEAEETTASDSSDTQARLDNPFGHTRTMFGPDGLRSSR